MENEPIISSTRAALGLEPEGPDFKNEIILHIDAALSILNQNGIGVENLDVQPETTWGNFRNSDQINGNVFFKLVPGYVFFKTKILFDPPPPSNVAFYDAYIQELLWRLRIAYEADNRPVVITVEGE